MDHEVSSTERPPENASAPSDDALRVIYITGISHTGSTLLGHVLGELEGTVYCGEIRNTWQRGLLENRLCTCGAPFRDCPFWSAVIERLSFDADERAATLARSHRRLTRVRERRTAALRRTPDARRADTEAYAGATRELYSAIADVAGARSIVDSSKSPLHAGFLDELPGLEVGVVHLVRDPRATAHSFRRREQLGYAGVFTRSLRWLSWNLACERLARRAPYVRVRYEDLVADPVATVERIAGALELPFTPPRLEGGFVELSAKHIFSGNRSRGESGLVRLRRDDEWREQLPAGMKTLARATTLPLLARYEYR